MTNKFLKFPNNFLWGVATSSHQIEGHCDNNDWSHVALKKHQDRIPWATEVIEKISDAGIACDSWNRFKEDIALIKELNNTIYRFSIEWSKIEPEEGKFDENAIAHYRKILEHCRAEGIKTMVTLHHFANPIWIAVYGGWTKKKTIKYFLRYTEKIVEKLGDLVDFWNTVNEPSGYSYCSYKIAQWVPLEANTLKMIKVFFNLAKAHKQAYYLIHKICRHKFNLNTPVGIANDLQAYSNYRKHNLIEQLKVYFFYNISNHLFYKLSGINTHDFLGINYYFEVRTHKHLAGQTANIHNVSVKHEDRFLTDAEWTIYPRGIYDVLYDLSDYKKPIYITENGIATTDDDTRIRFIQEHLEEIYYAIKAGIDIRGYCYWSLLDNFEWAEGYRPKFGLVSVDPNTKNRELKPSAKFYAKTAKENGIWWSY